MKFLSLLFLIFFACGGSEPEQKDPTSEYKHLMGEYSKCSSELITTGILLDFCQEAIISCTEDLERNRGPRHGI